MLLNQKIYGFQGCSVIGKIVCSYEHFYYTFAEINNLYIKIE